MSGGSETTMRAWVVERQAPVETGPLRYVQKPVPALGPGELLVRGLACGVCRTRPPWGGGGRGAAGRAPARRATGWGSGGCATPTAPAATAAAGTRTCAPTRATRA